jgi:transposase
MKTAAATFSPEEMSIMYVCGVDIGSQSCAGCILRLNKSVVVKPISFANTREGWQLWEEKLSQLDATPSQILIGMEATSRYGENLYQELEHRGYVLRLLHSGQTHQFHQQQRLRAKTDRLDAMTIARMLLSGEARAGYVPSEQVTTYRELVRLHTQLSDEAAAYQNEIQALVVVLFPEFTQVFADPCLPNALAVLKAFPSAQAVVEAGVEPLTQVLRAQKPVRYSRPTAQKLVAFAKQSMSSGRAVAGRSVSLRILCDQLEHTQAHLARLEADTLATSDQRPGGQRRATDPRIWFQDGGGITCRIRKYAAVYSDR